MTNRERVQAMLHYQKYDKIPVVSFGFWTETLRKWRDEGHIPANMVSNHPMADAEYDGINHMLGFDFNWNSTAGLSQYLLDPLFKAEVIETYSDGKQRVCDCEGNYVIQKPGVVSIPSTAGHTLMDRESWEKHYLPKLCYGAEKLDLLELAKLKDEDASRENPLGLFCGSMLGRLRNWLGLDNLAYLSVDDPELLRDMVDTIGELMYRQVKNILTYNIRFDYGHFWEDICGNDGPLVMPTLLDELAGPHYHRITDLLCEHGIDIVTVDCDGCIDHMVPIWLKHGVNTMFPIEVSHWNGSIGPWRKKYGKVLRGVGGMNKKVFAQDYSAIDRELERMRPLVELGGFIPCPDHRIPPDAKWENVQYYCDRFRKFF
ncbi:MAG: hypothetical protein RR547_04030 [Raoultibacter sp.]